MVSTPFHAIYTARKLSSYVYNSNKLISVFASSDIKIFPYQIAAAQFALRSPYLKGAILCDEGSLGKTYEAMLVVAQMWYEGKGRILIVIPTPLLYQWIEVIEERFTIPFFMVDNITAWESSCAEGMENPFKQEGIMITSYDFATEKSDYIKEVNWNLAVFEEAGRLCTIYTGKNKTAQTLKEATGNAFKLLLTPTPINKSILDIFGLIYFIDESVFPDVKTFYERYFRKPENYYELADRASKYCYRTLRSQVDSYVKIPKRIPITTEYSLSEKEEELYRLLEKYVGKPKKMAFPKMDNYDLTLLLFRIFSSSTFALERTLGGIVKRLEKMDCSDVFVCAEIDEVKNMFKLCASITENAKEKELMVSLKQGFKELKKRGANKKALIFTENLMTQKRLFSLLNAGEYKGKVLTYSGSESRDYDIIKSFAKEAQILIATDIASAGFNMEFCSFVINYDFPYNTLTIEQRINRCHRQNQNSDVIILNFFNKNNFADVRMLELINKRILQFRGIFGMSDDVIGNFGIDFSQLIAQTRTTIEVDADYRKALEEFEEENKTLVAQAEKTLFTSFSKEIAENVKITPQYIEEKIEEINNDLWDLTKYFFESKQRFYINEDSRSISYVGEPPKVFTGTALRRNEYSMQKDYQPRSGRHTIIGTLARNIISEINWIGVPEHGSIIVDREIEPCKVGLYRVKVSSKNNIGKNYYFNVLAGRTVSGIKLSHEDCAELMKLPVISFTKSAGKIEGKNRYMESQHKEDLDELINPSDFIKKMLEETDIAEKEEIERLKTESLYKKASLDKNIGNLRFDLKSMENKMSKDLPRIEKLRLEKQLNTMKKQLMTEEQNLFIVKMKIDLKFKSQEEAILDKAQITTEVWREFIINIGGKENGQ